MMMISSSSSSCPRCRYRGGGGVSRRLGIMAAIPFLLVFSRTVLLVSAAAAAAAAVAVETTNNHHHVLAQFSDQLRCPYAEKWLTKGPKQAALELGLNVDDFQAHYADASSLSLEDDEKQHVGAATSSSLLRRGASSDDAAARRRQLQQQEEGGGNNEWWNNSATTTNADTTCAIAVGPAGAAHQASYASGYRSDCPGTPAESSPYQWPLKWSATVYSQSLPFGSDTVIYESKSTVFYALDKNWKRSDTYYTRGVQRSVGQGPCPPDQIVSDPNNDALLACRRDSDQRRTMLHRGSKMYFINWKQDNTTTSGTTTGGQPQDPATDDVSQIQDCTWLDLAIVGNIRPDWFLDDRGDDTDVQYLGNQHVYYGTRETTTTNMPVPRLVKQWRKKDFASQYFTMSMLANPFNSTTSTNETQQPSAQQMMENGIHWPIILNVPGEGFGDDFLQSYSNHRLLTSDQDVWFLLDEAYVAAGGSCPELVTDFGEGGGDGFAEKNTTTSNTTTDATNTTTAPATNDTMSSFGPPVLETYVPSNLEVDERAWFSNVYTFSPVWEPPPKSSSSDGSSSSPANNANGMATTVAELATIHSCYDATKSAVYLKFAFDNVVDDLAFQPLPWMALSYRKDETCYMSPIDGSDGEIIFLQHNATTDESMVSFGSLPAALRGSSPEALASVYDSLVPLDQVPNGRYSQVALTINTDGDNAAVVAPMTTTNSSSSSSTAMVELEFYETMSQAPTVMYMNYAIGMSPTLGYHKNRLCFAITSFPPCAAAAETSTTRGVDEGDSTARCNGVGSSSRAMHTATNAIFWSAASALLGMVISS